jgi:hypothetical protein
MRLIDLDPRWCSENRLTGEQRTGMGMSFLCPVHRDHRLAVAFANPIDGGSVMTGHRYLWQREGETFETITLGPSVDASGHSHGDNIQTPCWHGFIRKGNVE